VEVWVPPEIAITGRKEALMRVQSIAAFDGLDVITDTDHLDLDPRVDADIKAAIADWFPDEDTLTRVACDIFLHGFEGTMQ
jgi:hypothetical protein